jgi:ABC-type polysaccharide/polyol phosphate transport system ATPase subunit
MSASVEFAGVSKRYRTVRERHNLRQAVPGPFGDRVLRDVHLALDDVSFRLDPGDTLGIIGPNGAGKSTILKLIARVTHPTSGRIEVEGRVAALIELGAGFHPDMTGRENVRFSAAVMGMSPRETAARFDDIVEFAEIGKYLDAPVKRYSAGMLARLGFAVASHVEAEVMVIDEVLSVGDDSFQRRCHEQIRVMRNKGCGIMFVSHNMRAVPTLCSRSILLENGRVVAVGDSSDVITAYRARGHSTTQRATGKAARIDSVVIDRPSIRPGDPLEAEIRMELEESIPEPRVLMRVGLASGGTEAGFSTMGSGIDLPRRGPCRLVCRIPSLPLQPGLWALRVAVVSGPDPGRIEAEHELRFDVDGDPVDVRRYGFMALGADWSVERSEG